MTGDIVEIADLIDEFVVESSEALDGAVDDILSLEQSPDQETVDRFFRAMHTIKGTAGMLNFRALSEFVHSVEDICSDVRSGDRKVDGRLADCLLKCLDFIQSKLDTIRDTRQEDGDCSQGEEYLRALQFPPAREGLNVAGPPSGPSPASEAVPEQVGELLPVEAGKALYRALIVEDEFAHRARLHSLLSRFMDCSVAKDGSEAIQAVTESYLGPNPEPFSLIVMDVGMPIIDGLQATRAIRELERAKGAGLTHARAKIVIAAAGDDEAIMQRAIDEYGADSHVAKPLSFQKVTRLLRQHRLLSPDSPQEEARERQCA